MSRIKIRRFVLYSLCLLLLIFGIRLYIYESSISKGFFDRGLLYDIRIDAIASTSSSLISEVVISEGASFAILDEATFASLGSKRFKPFARYFSPEFLKQCIMHSRKNHLFNQEIKIKIEKLLSKHGYSIVSLNEADYCLLFGYEMYPYSFSEPGEKYYVKTMFLHLIEANDLRGAQGKTWHVNVANTSVSSNLKEDIDYLLVVAFRYFGKEVVKFRKIILFGNNKEVRELRELVSSE